MIKNFKTMVKDNVEEVIAIVTILLVFAMLLYSANVGPIAVAENGKIIEILGMTIR